jgi:hypothetical protein
MTYNEEHLNGLLVNKFDVPAQAVREEATLGDRTRLAGQGRAVHHAGGTLGRRVRRGRRG